MKITVRAKPNAKEARLAKDSAGHFTISVREPARAGQVNRAIVAALAEHFGVSKNRVRIVSGHSSRNKITEIN